MVDAQDKPLADSKQVNGHSMSHYNPLDNCIPHPDHIAGRGTHDFVTAQLLEMARRYFRGAFRQNGIASTCATTVNSCSYFALHEPEGG
jgi:hypothetical protein